jgi:transglutaminase-like putative cysteine protease
VKLLRTFPIVAFTLVLLGIVTFCVARQSVTLLLVAGVAAAASWYVTEGPRGWSLPRWASNLAILGASVNVFFELLSGGDTVVGVLGRYAVWLTLIRLYERRTHREYANLMWMSLVLVVAGALESSDLLFGVALAAYAALGLYVLVLHQLYARYETSRAARRDEAPPEHRLVPPFKPVLGRHGLRHFRAFVAATGVAAAAIGVAFFALAPRGVGEGFIARLRFDRERSVPRYTSEVQLLAGTRISDSGTPVLTLRVLDERGAEITPPGPVYLRGAALDVYDTGTHRWRASAAAGRLTGEGETGPEGFTPVLPDLPPAQAPEILAIEPWSRFMLPPEQVFSTAAPVAISAESRCGFAFRGASATIRLEGNGSTVAYRVMVDSLPSEELLRAQSAGRPSGIPPQDRYRDPAVRGEALRVLREARIAWPPPQGVDPNRANAAAAEAIAEHLRRHYEYTLDLHDVSVGGDPIVAFLLDFRRGHCEYFASAMTAMCQSVGIDARLVTGYVAAEYDDLAGRFVVRERNAHAWVEVKTGRYGWSPYDPTPPQALIETHSPDHTLATRARSIYELFEAAWFSRIIDFDGAAQSRVREALNLDSLDWLNRLGARLREWLAAINRAFYMGPAGYIWMGIVAAAAIVAALVVVQLVRRSRRLRAALHLRGAGGAEHRRLLRQLGFYLDMLDVLDRGGAAKPPWQPPMAFAASIAPARPDVASSVDRLAALFYAVRYGERVLSSDEAADAERRLDALAAALGVRRSGR